MEHKMCAKWMIMMMIRQSEADITNEKGVSR